LLAATAVAITWRGASRAVSSATRQAPRGAQARTLLERVLAWSLAAQLATVVALSFGWSLHLPALKVTSVNRQTALVAVVAGLLLAISSRARRTVGRFVSSPVGLLGLVTLFAVVMSFGPLLHTRGLTYETSLYALFYTYVPGFDGLRVPARFAM